MRASDQTPGPSRRFLASSAASTSSASAGRNIFHKPLPTQTQPAASSSASNPRFQRPSAFQKDDIQTSFDDELADSPTLHRSHGPRGKHIGTDRIEDESQEEVQISSERRPHQTFDEVLAKSDLRSPSLGHSQYVTTSWKKRKVDHTSVADDEPIAISSSAEGDETAVDRGSDNSDELPEFHTESSVKSISRFKGVAVANSANMLQSRTAFRSMSKEAAGEPEASGFALPDMFSPSRRKGKRDYIPGGNADLVRSWVLDVAAQESQQVPKQQMIIVRKAERDSSGRCTVIQDCDDQKWLLPDHLDQPGNRSQGNPNLLQPGRKILLKGNATQWDLAIYGPSLKSIRVAAYWEFVS